jgi:hypothetical protein
MLEPSQVPLEIGMAVESIANHPEIDGNGCDNQEENNSYFN